MSLPTFKGVTMPPVRVANMILYPGGLCKVMTRWERLKWRLGWRA